MYQFEIINLTLGVSDDSSIQSVTWSGDGFDVLSGQNTQKPSIVITSTDTVTINANLQMMGCSNIISRTAKLIAKPHRLKLNAPAIIHDQGTLSIENLSPVIPVIWSVSNPSIATIDSQGTLVRNNNQRGKIQITAIVQLSSGSVALNTNVQIGFPNFYLSVINAEAFLLQEMYIPEIYYTDPITDLTFYRMVKVMDYPAYPFYDLSGNTAVLDKDVRYKFLAEPESFYGSYKESFHYIWTYSSLDNNSIVNRPIIYGSDAAYKPYNEFVKELGDVYIGIIEDSESEYIGTMSTQNDANPPLIKRNRGENETTPVDPKMIHPVIWKQSPAISPTVFVFPLRAAI